MLTGAIASSSEATEGVEAPGGSIAFNDVRNSPSQKSVNSNKFHEKSNDVEELQAHLKMQPQDLKPLHNTLLSEDAGFGRRKGKRRGKRKRTAKKKAKKEAKKKLTSKGKRTSLISSFKPGLVRKSKGKSKGKNKGKSKGKILKNAGAFQKSLQKDYTNIATQIQGATCTTNLKPCEGALNGLYEDEAGKLAGQKGLWFVPH